MSWHLSARMHLQSWPDGASPFHSATWCLERSPLWAHKHTTPRVALPSHFPPAKVSRSAWHFTPSVWAGWHLAQAKTEISLQWGTGIFAFCVCCLSWGQISAISIAKERVKILNVWVIGGGEIYWCKLIKLHHLFKCIDRTLHVKSLLHLESGCKHD